MSIFAKQKKRFDNNPNFKRCKRCGKWMYADRGDYGPECAEIMQASEAKAKSVKLPDGTIEVYDSKGERTAVIV